MPCTVALPLGLCLLLTTGAHAGSVDLGLGHKKIKSPDMSEEGFRLLDDFHDGVHTSSHRQTQPAYISCCTPTKHLALPELMSWLAARDYQRTRVPCGPRRLQQANRKQSSHTAASSRLRHTAAVRVIQLQRSGRARHTAAEQSQAD